MRRGYRSALMILAVSFSVGACKSLFYAPGESWLPISWLGPQRALEARLAFESRMSWNPLNQNQITRNVSTELLIHELRGDQLVSSRRLTRFDGWILSGSIYAAGHEAVMVAGEGNDIGAGANAALLVATDNGATRRLPVAGGEVLAAFPDLDSKRLAVAVLVAGAPLALEIRFFSLAGLRPEATARIELPSAIGPPEVGWSADSRTLYLRVVEGVLAINAESGSVSAAVQFPRCFRPAPAGGELNDGGWTILRRQQNPGTPGADSELRLERVAEAMRDDQAMTGRLEEIGQGCR
ncbi:MAG: hypothetical protein K1X75_09260 [Leptospirales bacterium]|nr:hypothetical protein [Leptospirales bacterium]